jgi:hypothetical protein
MPEPQFGGTNLRECEDQSWFKVQAVPVFRFDVRCFRIPPRVRVSQVADHWSRLICVTWLHGSYFRHPRKWRCVWEDVKERNCGWAPSC